jgi:hypothetical protein
MYVSDICSTNFGKDPYDMSRMHELMRTVVIRVLFLISYLKTCLDLYTFVLISTLEETPDSVHYCSVLTRQEMILQF